VLWACLDRHLRAGQGHFGLALLFEPVTFAADVDHRGAVQQAVQRGRSHDGVAGEDLAPVGKGLVAGEHDSLLLFVALTDGLEQQAGVCRFQGQVADYQQLRPGENFDLARETILFQGPRHAARQVDG